MALAAATSGELRIRGVVPEDLEGIRRHFRRIGLQTMVEGQDLLVPPEQKLTIRDDHGDMTSRRSTMAPGPPSRRTSPRSPSPWPPRRTGRS